MSDLSPNSLPLRSPNNIGKRLEFPKLKEKIVQNLENLNNKSLISDSIIRDYNTLFEKYNNFRREAMMGMFHRQNIMEVQSQDSSKLSKSDLESKLENLKRDYQLLEEKKNELSDRNSDISQKLFSFTEKNEKAQIKIQQLETENNALKQQMIIASKQSINKNNSLDNKTKSEYEKKIQQLSSENSALKNQSQQVQQIIMKLSKGNSAKDKEINELKKENEKLNNKIKELQEKLKKKK